MNRIRIHLFAEDQAHEVLLRPMIGRIAREESCQVDVLVMAARGGHGRVLTELDLYQKAWSSTKPLPDILVVGIDANCKGFAQAKREIVSHLGAEFQDRAVVACPDPHVERWYMADAEVFQKVVGGVAPSVKKKCQRDYFKNLLAESIRRAGQTPTLGGIEFAADLAAELDFYRAGKTDPAVKHFSEELRAKLKQFLLA
jgi:hypothetical protein